MTGDLTPQEAWTARKALTVGLCLSVALWCVILRALGVVL